ncbi:serine/threonine-protein kinase STY46 [Canna indica]|uniref:Serine/threonine-protein kinase STY46 n=1 Tax=Canna indica TaxID=4628 RepID=A0AAQ3K2B3_9LILI|nr:serine/threonine-protein kinase STY46 [Canna indica]
MVAVYADRTVAGPIRFCLSDQWHRHGGGRVEVSDSASPAWGRGSSFFGHYLRLQRDSRERSVSTNGATGIGLSERKNRSAENLYGYSATEALGQHAIELLVDACDFGIARNIIQLITMGESSWH